MGLFGDIVGGVTSAIGFGSQLVDAFGESDAEKRASQVSDEALDISRQLRSRADAGEIFREDYRSFADALNDFMIRNRRQMARTGGLGAIQPERRDEYASGELLRAVPELRRQARQEASGYLSGALGALRGSAAPLQVTAQESGRRNDQLLNALQGISLWSEGLGGGQPNVPWRDPDSGRVYYPDDGRSLSGLLSSSFR